MYMRCKNLMKLKRKAVDESFGGRLQKVKAGNKNHYIINGLSPGVSVVCLV